MEVNAKDWLDEVDQRTRDNALQIALLKQEVRANHEAVMKNSDVRLEAIMERFDRLEQGGWQLWSKLGGLVVVLSTAVWFTIVQPMQERMDVIDRRLLDAEKYRAGIVAESE